MSSEKEICAYCRDRIMDENYLNCMECEKDVHVKCLKRPGTPGDLLGDVFFQFECIHCTDDGKEAFIREKLSWLMAIVIALYNLSIQSHGLSHHGYFHWRTHIGHFIEKNWKYLFGASVKKKKKWIGSIAGALSHNSPTYFISGYEQVRESGWWKLRHPYSPKIYFDLYQTQSKQNSRQLKRPLEYNYLKNESNSRLYPLVKKIKTEPEVEISNSTFRMPIFNSVSSKYDNLFRSLEVKTELHPNEPILEQPFDNEIDMMLNIDTLDSVINGNANAEINVKIEDEDEEINVVDQETFNIETDLLNFLDESFTGSKCPENFLDDIPSDVINLSQLDKEIKEEPKDSELSMSQVLSNEPNIEFKPRVLEVVNFQQQRNANPNTCSINQSKKAARKQTNFDVKSKETTSKEIKSLFTKETKQVLNWIPGLVKNKEPVVNYSAISEYEELELLDKLERIVSSNKTKNIPYWVRRSYRKLCVRKRKRELGIHVMELDSPLPDNYKVRGKNFEIIDRYQLTTGIHEKIKESTSFYSRLMGEVHYERFISPHTGRNLHPFIYRNRSMTPPWLNLMIDLQQKTNNDMIIERSTIDFCYFQAQHVAPVNSLLRQLFWPGIDMTECLNYPDFTVVALYKKLVVGCAFMVPDVGHNEAYISFMAVRPCWQRSGIATFMLYHLTQTCMGKDITLHVSASNKAVCLYQKFGFKTEQVILNFYEKYFPYTSPESRHALLLRLTR